MTVAPDYPLVENASWTDKAMSSGMRALMAAVAGTVACGGCLCKDVSMNEVTSPDGARVVRLFTRDCGATTAAAAFVELRPSHWWSSASEVVALGEDKAIALRWTGARTLQVELTREAAEAILRQQLRVGDIVIDYVYPPKVGLGAR